MGRKHGSLLAGRQLRDHLTLGVLARYVPVDVVDGVLRDTGRWNFGRGNWSPASSYTSSWR